VGEMVQSLSLGVARVMAYERWGSGMPHNSSPSTTVQTGQFFFFFLLPSFVTRQTLVRTSHISDTPVHYPQLSSTYKASFASIPTYHKSLFLDTYNAPSQVSTTIPKTFRQVPGLIRSSRRCHL
jgi:hypothetical protein